MSEVKTERHSLFWEGTDHGRKRKLYKDQGRPLQRLTLKKKKRDPISKDNLRALKAVFIKGMNTRERQAPVVWS